MTVSPSLPSTKPLVVIPTYREADSLPAVLATVFGLERPPHVLIVDDASPDGTADIVRGHPEFGHRLFLLERPGKLGLGSAYRDGFAWVLQRDYTAAVEMDADLSHNPHDITRLLAALDEGADLAIGSRYAQGISVIHWPLHRLVLSLSAGMYTRAFTGLPLTDPTSGFKAINRRALERLRQEKVVAEGYGFQIELHFCAHRAGLRLTEIPIIFTERRDGQSKLTGGITAEAIVLVPRLGLRRLLGR